jgi:hypothetical protein
MKCLALASSELHRDHTRFALGGPNGTSDLRGLGELTSDLLSVADQHFWEDADTVMSQFDSGKPRFTPPNSDPHRSTLVTRPGPRHARFPGRCAALFRRYVPRG